MTSWCDVPVMSFLYPPHNEVVIGVYWFHSFHPSVHPASYVRSVAHTVLVGSISYLYILSSNFRRCRVLIFLQNNKILIFGKFLKFAILTLSCFDLMWITKSLVWVIVGWRWGGCWGYLSILPESPMDPLKFGLYFQKFAYGPWKFLWWRPWDLDKISAESPENVFENAVKMTANFQSD